MKVLLCCYACDPRYGSEPGMGWNFTYHISKYHDVHVLVEEEKFKENLLTFSKENPDIVAHISFHFIPKKRHRTLRKIWPPSYYWFYREWHKRTYEYAKELDKTENFDIIHQITLAGYRVPGYLWKLGKPFIWGPIGGFNHTAWKLTPHMGFYGFVFYSLRNIFNFFQKRFSYAARVVSHKAHCILTSDETSQHDIQKIWKRNAIVMNEVGTHPDSIADTPNQHSQSEELQICWAGILEPRKGLNLLLQALARCKHHHKLHVLGSGSCYKKWVKLAKDLHIESQVIFYGKQPLQEVYQLMKQSHVFCITSLSEGGTTTIVMEALQHGLPIIALNHCAFSSVINESCGVKIELKNMEQIINDIAYNLDFLHENEGVRRTMANNALLHAQNFTWEKKIKTLNAIYQQAHSQTVIH